MNILRHRSSINFSSINIWRFSYLHQNFVLYRAAKLDILIISLVCRWQVFQSSVTINNRINVQMHTCSCSTTHYFCTKNQCSVNRLPIIQYLLLIQTSQLGSSSHSETWSLKQPFYPPCNYILNV